MSDSEHNNKKSSKKKRTTDMAGVTASSHDASLATIAAALKKMDKDLARQVVISAVSMNATTFASTFATACELMWVKSLLDCIDRPEELRQSGYSAKDVCLLATERGFFVEREILQKAKEVDIIHKLDVYGSPGELASFDTFLDKEKSHE